MRWLMSRLPAALLTVALLAAFACSSGKDSAGGKQPDPPKTPLETAQRFFDLWKEKEYGDMYDLISAEARATISKEDFVKRYNAIAEEATITGIDYETGPNVVEEDTEIPVEVTIHTTFFGDISQGNRITLVREDVPLAASPEATPDTRKEWRVDWTPSLIFAELDDKSLVHFFTDVPQRGSILARNSEALAVDADLPVVGFVPDLMTDKEALISSLAAALKMPESDIRAKVETDLPSYYFISITTLPYGTSADTLEKFYALADLGVVVRQETRRIYPNGDSAAHVLGYMAEISEEQLKELSPKGYRPGDKVGAFGLEDQLDEVLAGERGGTLATISPEGTITHTIAEKPATPGKDVTLTLDINAQKTAETVLGERVGSIIVMDPRDNSVLALASYPRFNPQAITDGLSTAEYAALSNDKRQPFLHRPLLATYPPGSTFKPVTLAAGMEKAGVSAGETFHCVPVWKGLGEDFPKNNWQKVDRGYLTPAEGLMASCNPVFYEIALRLDHVDPNILPDFARGFGYGQLTGINGLDEAPGVVPDPEWKEENRGEPWYSGDSVNMGIGQGFLLVTPLQLANAYSAIAGGGVLRKPLLVRSISEAGGAAAQEFTAEEIAPLPVSAATLAEIRLGLTLVTQSPGGTSYQVFASSPLDVAGKSGTAEDLAFGADHVFFVAYANSSAPSVLTLVALEEGKLGSVEAGPKARKVLEAILGS
ncbi:MAG: penicillin-binding transpeptidase domain-containing protein [Dehalococcoidia bacterium]|nr:penicillin-binding transpeptidase domain-containing protein [Dehalococcoidia bacterium]